VFSRQKGGEGGYSGLDRERKIGNREEKRLSLYSITSFVFFVLFPRPTEKEVLWERLLFSRSYHRSWDEFTPHPAAQHGKNLQSWAVVVDQIHPQPSYGFFGSAGNSSFAKKDFVVPTPPPPPLPPNSFYSSFSYNICLRYSVVGPSPLLVGSSKRARRSDVTVAGETRHGEPGKQQWMDRIDMGS
jgi:hypothetical protein